jgi:hypothetical protein
LTEDNTQEVVEQEPEPARWVMEVAPAPEPSVAYEETPTPEVEVVEEPVALAASKKVVSLSNLVFESKSRNSASVGLVQFRLVELGFLDAGSDKFGWLSAGTMKSLAQFAKTSVEKVNAQDEKLISRLFEGTSVEVTN